MKTVPKAYLAAMLGLALAAGTALTPTPAMASEWVATWQASPQPTWGADFLLPANVPAVLH
ncbi:MAG: SGNH/GDSL hydrolase family protein, partial [Comamonas sp.]